MSTQGPSDNQSAKSAAKHTVKFGRIAPGIPVSDMARSIDFYSRILGMEKVFENGSPIGFAIMIRDQAELHLTLAKNHKATDRNIAHIMVEDATSLYTHLEASGVRIIKGMRDADYGLRQFVFADPDGNRIDIGQDI